MFFNFKMTKENQEEINVVSLDDLTNFDELQEEYTFANQWACTIFIIASFSYKTHQRQITICQLPVIKCCDFCKTYYEKYLNILCEKMVEKAIAKEI